METQTYLFPETEIFYLISLGAVLVRAGWSPLGPASPGPVGVFEVSAEG